MNTIKDLLELIDTMQVGQEIAINDNVSIRKNSYDTEVLVKFAAVSIKQFDSGKVEVSDNATNFNIDCEEDFYKKNPCPDGINQSLDEMSEDMHRSWYFNTCMEALSDFDPRLEG